MRRRNLTNAPVYAHAKDLITMVWCANGLWEYEVATRHAFDKYEDRTPVAFGEGYKTPEAAMEAASKFLAACAAHTAQMDRTGRLAMKEQREAEREAGITTAADRRRAIRKGTLPDVYSQVVTRIRKEEAL